MRRFSSSVALSMLIFTGTRCCIFTKLPAAFSVGISEYFEPGADLTDEADNATDTYQLEVPARDRITFSTLIARMGWPALSLRKTIGKVAAL